MNATVDYAAPYVTKTMPATQWAIAEATLATVVVVDRRSRFS
ncbi:hypothetical protein [Microbacterium sp. LMI1x-1-1.1]